MESFVKDYFFQVAAVLSGVVWLVRLEGRVNYHERELAALETKHTDLTNGIVKELSEVKQALARIEGWLQAHKEEK